MKKIFKFLSSVWEIILSNINICVFGVLIILCAFFMTKSCSQKNEIDRLSKSFYAISDSVEYFKTESGLNASKTKQAELTLEEFKTTTNLEIVHLNSTIKDLNLKLKKVNSASTGTTEIYIKDTIVLHDTVFNGKLYKSGIYTDTWTNLSFFVSSDTVNFDLSTKDTIDIIASQEKIGKFKFKNIFVKRPVVYTTIATMTRPNGKIDVKSFVLKK